MRAPIDQLVGVTLKVKAVVGAAIAAGLALGIRALRHSSDQSMPDRPEQGIGAAAGDTAQEVEPPPQATRAELYEEAKRRDIRGRSSMTKAELEAALGKEPEK